MTPALSLGGRPVKGYGNLLRKVPKWKPSENLLQSFGEKDGGW